MTDKYNISYYTDFLINLKREYGSTNDVCEKFNIGIKQHIDNIFKNASHFSESEWQNYKKIALSNTEDAKYLAIYMVESMLCPQHIVREIMDKTTDSDILIAGLANECDKKRIPYIINSINPEKLKKIARVAEATNEQPTFSAVALDYLATECTDKFDDKFLMFAHDWHCIEKMEKEQNGFTERQATYILKNLYLPDTFKKRIYNEYGCDVSNINESVSETICDDIFLSACQTIFEMPDIDDKTKRDACNIIFDLQEKKLISPTAQMKFIKWYEESDAHISFQKLTMTMNDIALTTESGLVYSLMKHPLKYRNPIATMSSISTVLTDEIGVLLSGSLTDRMYKEKVEYLADRILYQLPIGNIELKCLLAFIKEQNKEKKQILEKVALSIVSNPHIEKSTRNQFAKIYKSNNLIQVMNDINNKLILKGYDTKEINYIMECSFKKNNYIIKQPEERNPDVYINEPKFQLYSQMVKEFSLIYPDISSFLGCGLFIIAYERYYLKMYKEHHTMFAPETDYNLKSHMKDRKTLHILKLDRYDDKDLYEMYRKFELNELKILKNIIYSAVSYQDNKCYLYAWLDKYVRQYNIVNEILKEKMIEAQRENEEKIKESTTVFER